MSTKNSNQFLIDGHKFAPYRDKSCVCWLTDGRQYVVQPHGNGYLATFRNGYTSEVLERITWQKLQYCAMAHCQSHFERGEPKNFSRTGVHTWTRISNPSMNHNLE